MNIKTLLIGTLAAGMFASCSNDSLVEAPNESQKGFNEFGDGYLKIAIALPTTSGSSTRAIGDKGDNYGEFNDGAKYEYAVENAILVIFSGTGDDESKYTLQSAYQLNSGEWNMDGSTQITNNRTFIQQINNAGATGNLYAYVILNKHSFFEVNAGKLLFTCGQGDHVNFDLTGSTLAEFMKYEINESGRRYDANSFLMTNMPYAGKPGAGSNPAGTVIKTLYPINTSAIYASQTEAELGAAATEVNVERVLAKVQTSWNYQVGGTPSDHFETEDGNAYPATILGWFIDNTNKTTYVARNYEAPDGVGIEYLSYKSAHQTAPTYRFVSGAPVTTGAFRTFWAIDPNYNEKPAQSATNALLNEGGKFVNNTLMKYDASGNNIGGRLRDNGSSYYCTENTFDVAHQSHYNTTRVVVAADFGDAFYTIAQEAGKKYNEAGIIAYTKSRISERVHFMEWVEDYYKGADAAALIDVVVNNNGGKAGKASVTIGASPVGLTAGDIKAGKTLADAQTAWAKNVNDPTDGDNVYLAGNYSIEYYQDGVAYYSALIQHFGEDETPWDAANYAGQNNTVNGVYAHIPDNGNLDDNSYLGRYGVVRNNWYKIDVEGIRKIGSSTVPTLPGDEPDTPDDQVENFLKVKINITPWAIRKQSVKL